MGSSLFSAAAGAQSHVWSEVPCYEPATCPSSRISMRCPVWGSTPVAPALYTAESRRALGGFGEGPEVACEAWSWFDRDDLSVILPDLLEQARDDAVALRGEVSASRKRSKLDSRCSASVSCGSVPQIAASITSTERSARRGVVERSWGRSAPCQPRGLPNRIGQGRLAEHQRHAGLFFDGHVIFPNR